MTTATKTTQTETAKIEIKLTREVSDKINFSDGYNIPTGQEIYERYEAKITSIASGKSITASGNLGDFAFFATANKYQTLPAGAYARLGDAYISKPIYDAAMTIIAALDAEVSKSGEQIAIETEAAAAEKAHDNWYNSPEEIAARKFEREMNNHHSDY